MDNLVITMDNSTILLAVLPLIIIALGLDIYALVDLYNRDPSQVKGGNKWTWLLIILLINTIGPILYLVVGRTEGNGY